MVIIKKILLGVGVIFVFTFLLTSVYAVDLRNQNYNPKIRGLGGIVEDFNSLSLEKTSINFFDFPYSDRRGGEIHISGISDGKKLSADLILSENAVIEDNDNRIVVDVLGKGSWFNGKKKIRNLSIELTYTCDRVIKSLSIEAKGDIKFRLSHIKADYCGY